MALQRLIGNAAVSALMDEAQTGALPGTNGAAAPAVDHEEAAAANGNLPTIPVDLGFEIGGRAGVEAETPETAGEAASEAGAEGGIDAATGDQTSAEAGAAAATGGQTPAGAGAAPGVGAATAGQAAAEAGAEPGIDAATGDQTSAGAGAAAATGGQTPGGAGGASGGQTPAGAGAASGGQAAGAAPVGAAGGPNAAAAGAAPAAGAAAGVPAAATAGAAPGIGAAAAGPAAAAGAGGGAGAAAPPRDPHQDPGFQAMKKRGGQAAAGAKAHPPAAGEAASAQGAALPPSNDIQSQAAAAQVEEMGEQQPGTFDRKAFIAAVKKAVDKAAPKNLEEADDFAESGKAGEVKGEVSGLVKGGKKESEKDIKTATEAPPDASKAKPKPVTPMSKPEPGQAPKEVGAKDAMPQKRPPAETDLSSGPAEVDAKMAEADVTEEQLAKSNEPDFTGALKAREEAKTDSETRPEGYRKQEEQVLGASQDEAETKAATHLTGMHGSKVQALAKAMGTKGEAKGADEAKRAKVAADIDAIYSRTKADVTKILTDLDGKVETAFDKGEKAAREQFESHVGKRMDAYKEQRYSGIRGKFRWAKDKLFGMPSDVNVFYAEGRDGYLAAMDGVIGQVADIVGAELGAARKRIADGRAEVRKYVAELPKDLQKVGKDAEQNLDSQFDELSADVDAKQDQLVDTLAQKYVEARNALDERIEEMKAANRGLVNKALDAVVGVVKTILKLKDMLLGVLAKAADVIGDIIKDPIGFLSKLVDGVKSGLNKFLGNIASHLQKGLLDWLFGALGGAGIKLPAKLDLAGIFDLVMQVLGLTYENIRGRVAKLVGEPAVARMEQTVDFFKTLATKGVAGIWEFIKDQLANLEDLVLGQIKEFVIERVIKSGITWILSLLNPAAAFIKACKAIYDIVMWIVERGSQIMEFVNSVLDSIGAIAKGNIGIVADRVEGALAKALPVAISFLASLLGLGGISDKIRSILDTVRKPINKAVDTLVKGAIKGFKKMFGGAIGWAKGKYEKGKEWAKGKVEAGKEWAKGKAKRFAQLGLPEDPRERLELGKRAALAAVGRFAGRPVGESVLKPLLSGIKVRYGFKRLEVVPRGGRWHVSGAINPEFDEATDTLTPESLVSDKDDGQTLALGEGNFSFALSIAVKTMIGGRLVATDYVVEDRKKMLKPAEKKREAARNEFTQKNMAQLESMGVEVDRQVNATDPASYPTGSFDVIVFNHPFVPTKDEEGKTARGGEAANVELIRGFLTTAKQKIREGGKIVLISSKARLRRWKLDEIAEALDLEQSVMKFSAEEFPGYVHEKTLKPEGAATVKTSPQFAIIFTIKAETSEG